MHQALPTKSAERPRRTPKIELRWGRVILLLMGMSCLVTGIWGGLLRVPVALPLPVDHANWISFHGPLMICGFLGTLISLERAVGMRSLWTYLVPLLIGISAVSIATGTLSAWPRWTLTAGSVLFILVSLRILTIQPVLSNVVMGLGTAAWSVGNLLWASGSEIPLVVLWWLTFLLLTIVGERIELSRFQKPSPWSKPWLMFALGFLGTGVALGWRFPRPSGVAAGLGLLGIAAWLFRFDLAWRTIRHPGLPRFMAVCLLSGYVWLTVTAALVLMRWPQSSGLIYDATLHAFFVGFVFAMIFGHAPVIFPAVLGLPVHFRWTAYVPLAVLHGSVALRCIGDLANFSALRSWGAWGNAAAVGLFLLNTLAAIFMRPVKKRERSPNPICN